MPDSNDIELKLREILIEQGRIIATEQEINSATNIRNNLGLDEFQIIELTGAIEAEYDIQIDSDEAAKAETIGQFVELIQRSLVQ